MSCKVAVRNLQPKAIHSETKSVNVQLFLDGGIFISATPISLVKYGPKKIKKIKNLFTTTLFALMPS